jgi:hypothetical protein
MVVALVLLARPKEPLLAAARCDPFAAKLCHFAPRMWQPQTPQRQLQ